MSSLPNASTRTTLRCRSWQGQDADRPAPDLCADHRPFAAVDPPAACSPTRRIVAVSIRSRSGGVYRTDAAPTPTLGSTSSTTTPIAEEAPSSRPRVGRTAGARSLISRGSGADRSRGGQACGVTSRTGDPSPCADRQRGAQVHRRVLRQREGGSRSQRRGAAPHPATERPATRRYIRARRVNSPTPSVVLCRDGRPDAIH